MIPHPRPFNLVPKMDEIVKRIQDEILIQNLLTSIRSTRWNVYVPHQFLLESESANVSWRGPWLLSVGSQIMAWCTYCDCETCFLTLEPFANAAFFALTAGVTPSTETLDETIRRQVNRALVVSTGETSAARGGRKRIAARAWRMSRCIGRYQL
jgi:hypothetical protein